MTTVGVGYVGGSRLHLLKGEFGIGYLERKAAVQIPKEGECGMVERYLPSAFCFFGNMSRSPGEIEREAMKEWAAPALGWGEKRASKKAIAGGV